MPKPISIPYGRQYIDAGDIEAVIEVLLSDWLTQGPAIERFERDVARYCGSAHAVAVSNGTAALHLACLALDVLVLLIRATKTQSGCSSTAFLMA